MNPLMQNMGQFMNMMNMVRSMGDPNRMMENMLQTNPQFKAFYEANQGKSVEQIAQENNLDLGMVRNILNNIK